MKLKIKLTEVVEPKVAKGLSNYLRHVPSTLSWVIVKGEQPVLLFTSQVDQGLHPCFAYTFQDLMRLFGNNLPKLIVDDKGFWKVDPFVYKKTVKDGIAQPQVGYRYPLKTLSRHLLRSLKDGSIEVLKTETSFITVN